MYEKQSTGKFANSSKLSVPGFLSDESEEFMLHTCPYHVPVVVLLAHPKSRTAAPVARPFDSAIVSFGHQVFKRGGGQQKPRFFARVLTPNSFLDNKDPHNTEI